MSILKPPQICMNVPIGSQQVEIWTEEKMSGEAWRMLSEFCATAARATGDPYKVKIGSAVVTCTGPQEMLALIETLGAKLSSGDLADVIAKSIAAIDRNEAKEQVKR